MLARELITELIELHEKLRHKESMMQPVINAPEIATARNSSCLMAKISMCLSITKLRVQRTASARLL